MTAQRVVADDTLGQLSRKWLGIQQRILQGSLDPNRTLDSLQNILEGKGGEKILRASLARIEGSAWTIAGCSDALSDLEASPHSVGQILGARNPTVISWLQKHSFESVNVLLMRSRKQCPQQIVLDALSQRGYQLASPQALASFALQTLNSRDPFVRDWGSNWRVLSLLEGVDLPIGQNPPAKRFLTLNRGVKGYHVTLSRVDDINVNDMILVYGKE